ncbi:MAG TPA: PilN domain-containing protein [Stellaceae bacterium]
MDRSAMARAAERLNWPVRVEPVLQGALRWWLGELASFVPAPLRYRVAGLRSRYVLVSDDAGLSLWRETGREREAMGRIHQRTRLSSQRPLDVVLQMPAERALRIAAPLPLAAERNLDQVVGFEFERLLPFRRNEAYYTHRIVARDKVARNLQIELTAAPRSEIDGVVQAASRAGLHVTAVEIPAAAGDMPSLIALEKGGEVGTASRGRLVLAALTVLVLVLAAAAVALPFWRAEENRNQLSAAVATARRDAELGAKLQTQIDARLRDQHFLIDRRLHTPTVTELLDALTRLAPDDTWLTEFQITGSDVRLTGASNSATALLGLVEQAPSFRNAAFRSPVVQDSRLGRERFDLGAQIAPREAGNDPGRNER